MTKRVEIAKEILDLQDVMAGVRNVATSLLGMIERASHILKKLDDPDRVVTDELVPVSDGIAKLPTPPPYEEISVATVDNVTLKDDEYLISGDTLYLNHDIFFKHGIAPSNLSLIRVSYRHPGILESDVLPLMSQLGIDIDSIRRDVEWLDTIGRWIQDNILSRHPS
ncbi:MAG: hypothetical protein QXZ09_05550 [Candidatus Methanomethylicaceae archaeon]